MQLLMDRRRMGNGWIIELTRNFYAVPKDMKDLTDYEVIPR